MGQVGKYEKSSVRYYRFSFLIKLEKKAFGWKVLDDTYRTEGEYDFVYYDESEGRVKSGTAAKEFIMTANFVRPANYGDYANGALKVLEGIDKFLMKINHWCNFWLSFTLIGSILLGFLIQPLWVVAGILLMVMGIPLLARLGLLLAGFIIRGATKVDQKVDDELYDYGYNTFYEK